VFAGIPPRGTTGGWDRECGVPDSAEMMRRRRAEDERALALIGTRPAQLDFLDSQYSDDDRDVEAIASAVQGAAPQWSALYAPAAAGGCTELIGEPGTTLAPHPDHEAVREVAMHMRRSGVPMFFYAEIPYASGTARGHTWPESAADLTRVLEAAVGEPLALHIHEHSEAALERRIEALARYQTQHRKLRERPYDP